MQFGMLSLHILNSKFRERHRTLMADFYTQERGHKAVASCLLWVELRRLGFCGDSDPIGTQENASRSVLDPKICTWVQSGSMGTSLGLVAPARTPRSRAINSLTLIPVTPTLSGPKRAGHG